MEETSTVIVARNRGDCGDQISGRTDWGDVVFVWCLGLAPIVTGGWVFSVLIPEAMKLYPPKPGDVPAIPVDALFTAAAISIPVLCLIVWFLRKMTSGLNANNVNIDAWKSLIAKHHAIRAATTVYGMNQSDTMDSSVARDPGITSLHSALERAQSLEPEDVYAIQFIDPTNSEFAKAVDDLNAAFHTSALVEPRAV